MGLTLRPYQSEAVEAAREKLRGGCKALVISAPTGAGKTEIAMAIIEAAAAKGSRVSFLADRRSLVKQTSDRFAAAGIDHGVVMGKDTINDHANIRVESVQTVAKRGLNRSMLDYARGPSDLFIRDECHELNPKLLEEIKSSGATLVGLTATPFPEELAEYYDDMVNVVSTDALIKDDHLCPFDVISPTQVVDTAGVATQGGEFKKSELSERVLRIVGDIVPTWESQITERYGGTIQPTIAFGASVDDSEEILTAFLDGGYSARLVSSREKDDDNRSVIAAFVAGEFDVLVNCAMLSRGFDAPRTTILIDAYPMRKILTPIQRYGRVMRTYPGKMKALIIDHAENWLRMRDPIMRFYTSGPDPLGDGANSKAAREKEIPKDSICRACRQVLAPTDAVCPNCGVARPVRTWGGSGSTLEKVNGTLTLVDTVSGETAKYGGDLWPEICTITAADVPDPERARKRAFASYKAITGSWPSGKYAPLDRAPDPAVKGLVRRNFQAWIIAKKHERKAAAQ